MRFWVKFFFCLWMTSFSSAICWKDRPSSIELLLHLCENPAGGISVGVFLGSLSHSTDLCVYSSTNTTQPWLLQLLSNKPQNCVKRFVCWSYILKPCKAHLVVMGVFSVDSLGFSMKIILSSANWDSFISSCSICAPCF